MRSASWRASVASCANCCSAENRSWKTIARAAVPRPATIRTTIPKARFTVPSDSVLTVGATWALPPPTTRRGPARGEQHTALPFFSQAQFGCQNKFWPGVPEEQPGGSRDFPAVARGLGFRPQLSRKVSQECQDWERVLHISKASRAEALDFPQIGDSPLWSAGCWIICQAGVSPLLCEGLTRPNLRDRSGHRSSKRRRRPQWMVSSLPRPTAPTTAATRSAPTVAEAFQPGQPAMEPRSSARTATWRSLSPGACDSGRNRPAGCIRCASAVPTNGRCLTAYIVVGV